MFDATPRVGDHWVYRKSDSASSEHVKVLGIHEQGRKQRTEIQFIAGGEGARIEVVPLSRLRTPWDNADAFDVYMTNWARLAAFELHNVEERAIDYVFEVLVPEEVASAYHKPDYYVLTVHDPMKFEDLVGCTVADVAARCFSCEMDGKTLLSREGTLIVAELACRRNPQPLLDIIHDEEVEARELCKRGGQRTGTSERDSDTTSPYWEWDRYIEYTRPRLELLRQWCGFRAVAADERRRAAEDELRRLDLLLVRAIDEVKQHAPVLADILEQSHDRERITPERVRPQIDRPLHPSEIPVREIKVRSRRWW